MIRVADQERWSSLLAVDDIVRCLVVSKKNRFWYSNEARSERRPVGIALTTTVMRRQRRGSQLSF